jgi:hypothetical protein
MSIHHIFKLHKRHGYSQRISALQLERFFREMRYNTGRFTSLFFRRFLQKNIYGDLDPCQL